MVRYQTGVALVIVDVQNDFADPRGSLSVRGAPDVIPVINREAALALASGGFLVLTQDWHPERTPHFARDGGPWPVHCVADTWGAELHPALDVPSGTCIVRKGSNGEDGYSAFTMRDPGTGAEIPTILQPLLETAGVEEVVVVGLATDYCVKATALDAARLGFRTTVLTDGIAAVNVQDGDGARALEEMAAAGVVIDASGAIDGRGDRRERDTLTAPMIRRPLRLLLLVAIALPIAFVVDRVLAARRGSAPPRPLRMLVVIDAPIERTWAVVADIALQLAWMHEMKDIRLLTPGPARVGTRGEATVRIFGISMTDPVEVTELEPPTRYAISHDGLFKGGGVITLEPGADGTTTIVRWDETLVPPFLPELGARLQAPILREIFQADLHRLKQLVETGDTD